MEKFNQKTDSSDIARANNLDLVKMFDFIDIGIMKIFLDDVFTIEYINTTGLDLLGYSAEEYDDEIKGRLFNFRIMDDLERFVSVLRKAKSGDAVKEFKTRVKCKNGNINWFAARGSFAQDTMGRDCVFFYFKKIDSVEMCFGEDFSVENLLGNAKTGLLICEYDSRFTILYSNAEYNNLIGHSASEVKAKFYNKHLNLLIQSEYKLVSKQIEAELLEKSKYSVEYSVVKSNGKMAHVLETGSLIKSKKNTRVFITITDITQPKNRAETLIKKGMELKDIINTIDIAVVKCLTDSKLTLEFANHEFYNLLGYSKKQFEDECDNCISSVINEDDLAAMFRDVAHQGEIMNVVVFLARMFLRNGTMIWAKISGNITYNDEGDEEFYGVVTDVTRQKEQEQALAVSEKRYEIAMSFADLQVFDYDIKTKRIINNPIDVLEFNIPRVMENAVDEFIERGVIASGSVDDFRMMYKRLEDGAKQSGAIIRVYNNEGQEEVLQFSLTNIFDESGNPIRAIGIKKDITKEIALEKEREYGKAFMSKSILTYEANITKDQILDYDITWSEQNRLTEFNSFTGLVNEIVDKLVHVDSKEHFKENMETNHLIDLYEKGEKSIVFDYYKKMPDGEYAWFEKIVNIIKDEMTSDIYIRCYINNINNRKLKELKALEEQKFYESMLAKASMVYEINITKNNFVSGHEDWGKTYGINVSNNYDDMMVEFTQNLIHPEDVHKLEVLRRHNLMNALLNGESEVIYECRKKDGKSGYKWDRCTIHLFDDVNTGEMKAFVYVEDINDQKLKELELVYKSEHDMLTDCYNKLATFEYVEKCIEESDEATDSHVFYMMDIDRFKAVNDNFGHAFGDVILVQVANKIKSFFRDCDIVGRIGGDEFVVFMKNASDLRAITEKAQEVCDAIREVYMQNGIAYEISSSIGIAQYGVDGVTYEDLYKCADIALYHSKEDGRDRYCVYSELRKEEAQDEEMEIETKRSLKVPSSSKGVMEHIFRVMYENTDKTFAINSVLALVGNYYDADRVYIFETSFDGEYLNNTFEWCNDGISAQAANLQNLRMSEMEDYNSNFNEQGVYALTDVRKTKPSVRENLLSQGIKRMVQFEIKKDGRYVGFIGLDQCVHIKLWSDEDVMQLRNISNLISVFLLELRANQKVIEMDKIVNSLINSTDAYQYVCNPENYEVLFMSENLNELVISPKYREVCYKLFWKRDEPCKACPMQELLKTQGERYSMDLFNPNFNMHVKATAGWINWLDQKRMCLIDSVDVTSYINRKK